MKRLLRGSPSNSEIQLQGELDLSRIVGRVASRSDLAKFACVCEVSRASDCDHTVAPEIGSVEVRVIEYVEKFGPKLQAEALINVEIFKE